MSGAGRLSAMDQAWRLSPLRQGVHHPLIWVRSGRRGAGAGVVPKGDGVVSQGNGVWSRAPSPPSRAARCVPIRLKVAAT